MDDAQALDPRNTLLLMGCLGLFVSGWYYGLKFLRRKNEFLGYEFIILGTSGANFLFFNATLNQTSYNLMVYLDAFSRAFGFPIIAVLGFLVVTHGFRPTRRLEIGLFAITFALTAGLIYLEVFASSLAYIYLGAWTFFTLVLLYICKLLLDTRNNAQSIMLFSATLGCFTIAAIYDFWVIPNDANNLIFNFYFLALVTWTLTLPAVYHAYVALEASTKSDLTSARSTIEVY